MNKKLRQSTNNSQDLPDEQAKNPRASTHTDPGHYPAADRSYRGFYAGMDPCNKEGKIFLSGSEGIVGTELYFRQSDTGLELFTSDNRHIATMEKRASNNLTELLSQGWTIRCRLAYTLFIAENKTFSAQLACFCYAPWIPEEQKEALENFIRNMTDRIASASHPSLTLTQEQFNRVLESKGEWYLTKDEPWPDLPKGSVYYRRQRTYKDRLVGAALKGNKGCLIASWAAMFVIIAAIIYAIWYFFF